MNELLNKAVSWFNMMGIITVSRNNRLYVQKAGIEAMEGLQPANMGMLTYVLTELRKDCGTNKYYYWAELGEEWIQLDTM